MQCPYYVHQALTVALGLPADHVRVVQTRDRRRLRRQGRVPVDDRRPRRAARAQGRRPVKMIYDRVEDMVATTKRHPSIVRHRTGVTRDGRLVAMDIDVVMDGGAYCTLSPVVLSRGVHSRQRARIAATNVRIRGRAMMTNTPPNGAFRGFGAPQTQFAVEVHMDRIAEALGIDPVTAARDATRCVPATRRRPARCCADDTQRARRCCSEAVERTGFTRKRRASGRAPNRGIGLSLFFHGSGFTGGGEMKLASQGVARADRDAACASSWRAPRSARARARCTRRSSPTRWASRTRRSRSRDADTAGCPTAARRWRRAPA